MTQNTKPKTLHRGGLHGAIGSGLEALYRNYEAIYEQWCGESAERPMPTPPVFIAVAGNIANAEALHDYIAGYAEEGVDGNRVYQPGACSLFSNVLPDRSGWEPSVRTLLAHSQLDQETAISKGSRLGRAISAQAALLREMGDGALAGMDDQAVVREALNTVGKVGKLGEQIRCVVSVSMLTEGWDAKCTHILGYRAFSTQLLCEQVVGRALRRSSYDVGEDGLLRRSSPRSWAYRSTSSRLHRDTSRRNRNRGRPMRSRHCPAAGTGNLGDADQLPAVVQHQRHRYSGRDGRCSHPRLRRVNDGLGASRTSKTRPYTRACITGPAWPTRDGSAFPPLGSGLSRPGARSGRP